MTRTAAIKIHNELFVTRLIYYELGKCKRGQLRAHHESRAYFIRHIFNRNEILNKTQSIFYIFFRGRKTRGMFVFTSRTPTSTSTRPLLLSFFLMRFGDYRASWCQSDLNQCPADVCPESNNRWTRAGVTGGLFPRPQRVQTSQRL